jgi:uncharacterized protein (DUF2147 family)
MKRLVHLIVAAFAFCFASSGVFAAPDLNNTLWKTIDDVTGKPKSIIKLTVGANHEVQGTVMKIFPRPGYDQHELCSACQGDLHNKPIVSMVVLQHLKQDQAHPARYDGGRILDPHNGKTYRCVMQLSGDQQELTVRGYVGLSLFGRSQVWHRVETL